MSHEENAVVYWDTSAILSLFFWDDHTDKARAYIRNDYTFHLLSTLSWCEAVAVISRLQREHILEQAQAERTIDAILEGPWKFLNINPKPSIARRLARKWSLHGADLWHLATAKTLQMELPEIFLLTFDKRLNTAARGERLGS